MNSTEFNAKTYFDAIYARPVILEAKKLTILSKLSIHRELAIKQFQL